MNPHIIPGELQLFSKVRYGKTKKGISLYRFVPFNSEYPIAKVATTYGKTHTEQTNIYILAQYNNEELQTKDATNKLVRATLVDILGPINDETTGFLAIQYHYLGYNSYRTSKNKKRILQETNLSQNYSNIPIYPHRQIQSRTVYNPEILCTIDPEGCQDIDDAISFEIIDSKKALIGVHITDVDEIVKEDSSLDKWFQEQPFTLYRPDSIQHSLPESLSTNECSLLPNQKRGTLSVLYYLEYQKDDTSQEIQITKVTPELNAFVIESKEKLTYSEATERISTNSQWKQFSSFIKEWQEVEKQYSHSLENDEKDNDSFSHNMIAFLMIRTNAYIAEKLLIHPDNEKVLLRSHGSICQEKLDKEATNNWNTLHAKYVLSDKAIPHTALQLNAYTHFTSPIRRYADLLVHRQVKNKLLPFLLRENNVKTEMCERINKYQKDLHRVETSWEWWKYIQQKYNSDEIEIHEKGIILDWGDFEDDSKYGLSVFIQFGNRRAWVRVIHPQLLHLVKITRNENDIEIKTLSDEKTWKVNLFQEVEIKCWWDSSRGIRGIRFYWIDPVLPSFISQSNMSSFEEPVYTLQDWIA